MMKKYVLLEYRNLKLLIDEECSLEPFLAHSNEIETLAKETKYFYAHMLKFTEDEVANIETKRRDLISKVGYDIIGVPFSPHDAELYAQHHKLDYTVLELGDHTHTNKIAEREHERINIDVEKPLKTLAVHHVNNSYHKNLTEYIEYLIKKDLDI